MYTKKEWIFNWDWGYNIYLVALYIRRHALMDLEGKITEQQLKIIVRLNIELKTTKEVAKILSLSEHTVSDHRRDAYLRLWINSQEEALNILMNAWYTNPLFELSPKSEFSDRENEIIKSLVEKTHSNQRSIAESMFISPYTFSSHIHNVAEKLEYTWKKKKLFITWRWIKNTLD